MAVIFYEKDADLTLLKGRIIAVIGFGSQGHAHAQNLKDSGCQVVVGEVPGSDGWRKAQSAGLKIMNANEAAREGSVIVMLVPDTLQPSVYREAIEKNLTAGKMLMFAHGFNIHYGQIVPPANVDVTMVAPKCPGQKVRELYVEGSGPPAIIAVEQDSTGKARAFALAYAKGIGCTRAGVIETTFMEETETDLFGEQAVLCGGVSHLIKAGFDTLVNAGYQPEIAYFECLHELKLIVDLLYKGGISHMRNVVSDTAEYGDYTRGPRVIDGRVRSEMARILAEIKDGSFAREWILENLAGRPSFGITKKKEASDQIEEVGKRLRDMMPWLKV